MGFTLNQLEQERQIRKLQKKEDKDTKDYEQLSNLPKINNVELKGDKTTSDLGINANNVMMSDGTTSVEEAVDAVNSGLTSLHYHKIAESASTGTYAVKLQSLATAYNSLSLAQKRSALLVINAVDVYHPVNCSGNWFSVWVESSGSYLTRYGIDGSAYVETGGTVTNNSSVENANVFEVWICEP